MKATLFATTAAAAIAVGSMASAQGITLFGDARLGLGYGVSNDGDILAFDDSINDGDDLRAVSRVRFGVRMTGETPTGITFGATIRADNAIGGEGNRGGDEDNQYSGSVFVSGTYGTLTFGDIEDAHAQHVGDLPEIGLVNIGEFNELPYLGNDLGGDEFRPTVRYDYDLAGFGISLSTGSELGSWGIGASYALDFAGGSFTVGAGYLKGDETSVGIQEGTSGDDADQIAVGVIGEFSDFMAQVSYLKTDTDNAGDLDLLAVGLGTTFGAFGVNANFIHALDAPGNLDGESVYGVGFTYDLGGGAELKGGVMRVVDLYSFDPDADDDHETVADFGISLSF